MHWRYKGNHLESTTKLAATLLRSCCMSSHSPALGRCAALCVPGSSVGAGGAAALCVPGSSVSAGGNGRKQARPPGRVWASIPPPYYSRGPHPTPSFQGRAYGPSVAQAEWRLLCCGWAAGFIGGATRCGVGPGEAGPSHVDAT